MKDPEKENDHFVRLTGKGNIPSGLEIGRNYALKANGTVTSITESDKNDGSHCLYYKFEPVTIELIDDLGESIKAKDTRSLSQLFRARVWKNWSKAPLSLTFEEYYERLMRRLIQQVDEITEMFGE